ncbi:MAG: UDP-N-acetylmuramoyl-L-alanyl-D-glutamate--2,6-diaminopimelate ligase [Propionibacteriales bacterium]|nr:UDP-N-acetylmuramoyl-L-alanyl-D-glutamate--2,6-diaminopimelate ligase [Propionibacteriales bacterium]
MSGGVVLRPSAVRPVGLDTIAGWIGGTVHGPTVDVTGVTLDSRAVRPGDLYTALPGSRVHGSGFAGDARSSGAVAVLTDPAGASGAAEAGLPVCVVDAPRSVLGVLAARLYGDPAASLTTVGITGTHGKTTTAALAEAGLSQATGRAASIGTVGARIFGEYVKTPLTTPEAPDLHAMFGYMREQGVGACAMEVSSHALVMGRVDGVVFDVAVFLNLGRDHLDFHRDLDDYFAAKSRLFSPERARSGLASVDDEHGRWLSAHAVIPTRTMSASGAEADWRATEVRPRAYGTDFALIAPDGSRHDAAVEMPGKFNVANALAAVAAIGEAGFSIDEAIAGVSSVTGVPGRMERIEEGQDFVVVVDYAHKPDAVTAVLSALSEVTRGRVITVLGAGGDRDRGKRPLMGETAARLSDVLVVTDDNPRSEDPAAIRAALLEGARRVAADERAELLDVGDRAKAIEAAVGLAVSGDCVLIAGKGHEPGQEIAGVVHPFDDREVARRALISRGGGS